MRREVSAAVNIGAVITWRPKTGAKNRQKDAIIPCCRIKKWNAVLMIYEHVDFFLEIYRFYDLSPPFFLIFTNDIIK